MKKYLFLFFLCALSISYANRFHAFFVTISEIEYNESQQSLEIAIKIFTDDLEKALNSRFTGKANLGTSQETADITGNLKTYLSERFAVSVDGASQICDYIGKEKEDDATWCYLEVTNLSGASSITVKNAILTELYESQNNIVHVKVRGISKSMMLKRNASSGMVSF